MPKFKIGDYVIFTYGDTGRRCSAKIIGDTSLRYSSGSVFEIESENGYIYDVCEKHLNLDPIKYIKKLKEGKA